ncbi:MAG: lipocalin family protein [Burkholderiales bacterium]
MSWQLPFLKHSSRRAARGTAALTICSLLLLGACASQPQATLPTVASVDLAGYMGNWYEIARLPNRFQRDCVADTQASYTLEGDSVAVVNRCRDKNGKIERAEGVAHVVEGSSNAKLRVSFFRPFYGDYWILAFGPARQWVLVGEPGRDNAWVLARSPQLPPPQLDAALSRAAELGFDRAAFLRTPQTQPLQ